MLNNTTLKKPTYPTHPDYYSLVIKFKVLGLSKFWFLRPVLLEEAKGIHMTNYAYIKLVPRVFCIVQVALT